MDIGHQSLCNCLGRGLDLVYSGASPTVLEELVRKPAKATPAQDVPEANQIPASPDQEDPETSKNPGGQKGKVF